MFGTNCKSIYSMVICYPTGARGNFLNAVLHDLVDEKKFAEFDLKSYSQNYYKIHCLADSLKYSQQKKVDFTIGKEVVTDYSSFFSAIKSQNMYSIRIIPKTINGLIDLSYLGLSKHKAQFDKWALHGMCKHSVDQIEEDLQYRCYYDQIVYFEDLFDVNKINSIYNTITQRQLADDAIKSIEYNNVLQQNAIDKFRSQEQFQEIFPIVEQQFARKILQGLF